MNYNEIEMVKELAKARARMAANKDAMNALLDEIKSSEMYMGLDKKFSDAKERVDKLETDIRANIYTNALSGIKPDHPALGFRNKTDVSFDEEDAITWAISKNFHNLLQIQKTKFTKLAKSLVEAGQEVPGVAINTTPQPTIKTDLSEYLDD